MSLLDRFSEKDRQVLEARARRIAQIVDADQDIDVIEALAVNIQGEKYALPIDVLTSVYEGVSVVPVPCTPPYVSGIANVRGRIVPVFDLATLLNLAEDTHDETSMLIVASDDRVTLAFRVNDVGDSVAIANSEIGNVQGNTNNNYLSGVLQDGTALVNVRAILNDPGLVVRSNSTVN